MRSHLTHPASLAIIAFSLAALATTDAAPQALCPGDGAPFRVNQVTHPPFAMTIDADLAAPGGGLEGPWRPASAHGPDEDGLALEGISFARTIDPGFGSMAHAYVITADLRAFGNKIADLEFVLVQGARLLRLGTIEKVELRCEAKTISRTFTIDDADLAWLFAGGKAPQLRVTRTTRAGEGC
jgi:hypothetical protein